MAAKKLLRDLLAAHCLCRTDVLECTALNPIECVDCLAAHLISQGVPAEVDCEYCTGKQKPIPTYTNEVEMVKLIPLPAIDLCTGKMDDTADPPFCALRIESFDGEEDFIPVRHCPMCGRRLCADEVSNG